MSYILDALRRADAERERGRVPGLHAQALPLRTSDNETAPRQPHPRPTRRLVAMVLVLTVLAMLAALAWRGFGDAGSDAANPGTALPTPPKDDAPAISEPSGAAAAGTSATPAAPAGVSTARPASSTPPTAAAGSVATAPQAPVASAAPILAPAPPTPPAPPAARPDGGARTPASADEDTLVRVADLPPGARAGLPPLQVSGTTYADNPALRMLIVDGKVLQEGQDIAPGLRLESIGPRSAVLNQQGRRLRLTY